MREGPVKWTDGSSVPRDTNRLRQEARPVEGNGQRAAFQL